MIRSVYIDTTIPSYYYEERPELALHQDITRRWWDDERPDYDVYISEIVIMELNRGSYPHKTEILQLVDEIPILETPDEISEIVQVYIKRNLMPRIDLGDAFHLALASYHKIDFLLTWNCRNLANANKFSHIWLVNTQLGLFTPQIITPEQLFSEGDG
jgi:predicted nucleic acid-binding protein